VLSSLRAEWSHQSGPTRNYPEMTGGKPHPRPKRRGNRTRVVDGFVEFTTVNHGPNRTAVTKPRQRGVSLCCWRGISPAVTSLWLSDRVEQPWAASQLDDGPRSADVIVVGAGITGLMTALLLARAGKDVLVLEARSVGACATGNTTAKVSLLQGSHLSKILSKHGKNVARAYVDGNRQGQEWVLNHCESTRRGAAA